MSAGPFDAHVDAAADGEAVGTWLDAGQQRVWRQWLDVSTGLLETLDRGLQEDADLSLADFGVLGRLSEHPDGRLPVSDLGEGLPWEGDVLPRQVAQMVQRGLVTTEEVPGHGGGHGGGGGSQLTLTQAGRDALGAAAPSHVGLVRFLLFDTLTREEVTTLDRIIAQVARRLADLQGTPPG